MRTDPWAFISTAHPPLGHPTRKLQPLPTPSPILNGIVSIHRLHSRCFTSLSRQRIEEHVIFPSSDLDRSPLEFGPVRVRLTDVAVAAGVSLATASRALSGGKNVSPHAVAAVNTAVEQLGYRRNRVAQALRPRSTGLVGIVAPQVSNPFFAALIEALDRELRDEDLELILADSRASVEEERVVSRFLSTTMSTPSSSSRQIIT